MTDAVLQDLRHAIRAMRSSPGFAAVAILSLALGIGANTAIFSLIDAVILKTLPVCNPEQLLQVTIGKNPYYPNLVAIPGQHRLSSSTENVRPIAVRRPSVSKN